MQVAILILIQCVLKELLITEEVSTARLVAINILTCHSFFIECCRFHQLYRVINRNGE